MNIFLNNAFLPANINFAGKKTKKICQEIHFINACNIRVGEQLNSKEIVKLIQERKLPFFDKQSNSITRWVYKYKDKDYIVVYNKNTKKIASILPYNEEMRNQSIGKTNQLFWWLLKDNKTE